MEDFETTYFFYDLETSGLDPRNDRIMQFAGIRTDLDFNQIGDPVNILVKLADDTLPSPGAINVTHITPQQTQLDGLSEPEFCKYVQEEIFTPGTIEVGYNSVRFDDEHMRYTFYRNFYDPYEWQWKDGRSRWDLLDVVRMVRALRPQGISWPFNEDGKPNNRLENLTKENNLPHEHAHDALSDVEALISVTKMVKEKQPKLFEYLFKIRNKKILASQFGLSKTPFVYTSGRYSSEFWHTTVVFPLCKLKNGNILVFDLRNNLEELFEKEKSYKSEEKVDRSGRKYLTKFSWSPAVKELAFNKCPCVAPIGVLDSEAEEGKTSWERINLTKEQVEKNLEILEKHLPEFSERIKKAFEDKKDSYESSKDADAQLYDGFIPDSDKLKMKDVRGRNANELADYHPIFEDHRLDELLLHYKGRNFPNSFDEHEQKAWEKYRIARLQSQEQKFIAELEQLKDEMDPGLVEDLLLWYQSLASSDFE